jgi:hypothetical protein
MGSGITAGQNRDSDQTRGKEISYGKEMYFFHDELQ